jgi:hypothetical protein
VRRLDAALASFRRDQQQSGDKSPHSKEARQINVGFQIKRREIAEAFSRRELVQRTYL